jgi:ATP-dependent DNA ligase
MKDGNLASLPVPPDTPPMEARIVDALPSGGGWQFEPKWDGFRCLAFRAGDAVELKAKSGKSLARYFPEITDALHGLGSRSFVVDGELVVPMGATLSFDALQMRLHPAASRIRKLAGETPALLILFDCLMTDDGDRLLVASLDERRAALEGMFRSWGRQALLRLTPFTRQRRQAQRWLEQSLGGLDGIVAKRVDGPYEPGERAMVKVKQLRTADCVVGGFRYGRGSRQVGSLLLGLYDRDGKLNHVGFTSGIADVERPALTLRLEKLKGPPGFTGDAPGGPSRWSTERTGAWEPLRPRLVVEVQYDHVTGGRFRHGTRFVRWRPDKAPRQCRCEQMQREVRPDRLMGMLR